MTISTPDLEVRLREALAAWADEAPASHDAWERLTAAAERDRRSRVLGGRARRRRAPIVISALAVAAALAAVLLVAPRLTGDDVQVSVIDDPRSASVDRIESGNVGVRSLLVHDGRVWLASVFDERLYEIDPDTAAIVREWEIPSHVEGLRGAGPGALWLGRYDPDEVVRFDLSSGEITGRASFDSQPAFVEAFGSLWVADDGPEGGTLHRLDPETLEESATIPLGHPHGFLAIGEDVLWMTSLGDGHAVLRIDPETEQVTETAGIAELGGDVRAIVADPSGQVWATVGDRVVGIDPQRAEVTEVIDVGRRPHSLVTQDGVIWVSNFDDGTISRIDPSTDPPSVTTSVAGIRPGSLAAGFDSLWVSLHQEAAVLRVGTRAVLPSAPEADVVEYVDTPGGEIYIRCSGSPAVDRPTVVLEADHGRGAGSWAAVEPKLSSLGRVCATDRALTGRAAETAVAGRNARELASDLRIALRQVGEVGPYVVVGHGWGALPAQMFAHGFPGEVVGLVLVAPLPPTWFDEVRPLLSAEDTAAMDNALRDDPELSGTAESIRLLTSAGPLGDLPLAVVAAAELSVTPFGDPERDRQRAELLGRLVREQALSSSRGELTVAYGSDQLVPQRQPDVIVDAVNRVIERSTS